MTQTNNERNLADLATASPEQLAEFTSIGFDSVIGFRYTEITADGLKAELTINPTLHQPHGIVHGGVYCSVIESVASASAAVWLGGEGRVVGVNNNTDFLRAISSGKVFAQSFPIHRGRSQQLWRVVITDEQDRTIAQGQVRLANLSDRKE
jgi:uncharacterized protein (TIGR00369 family)